MGWIKIKEVAELLANTIKELKRILSKIDKCTEFEYKYFIIILAQYLYLYYCPKVNLRNEDDTEYYITAASIATVVNKEIGKLATYVVDCRNRLCHDVGSLDQEKAYAEVSDYNSLIPLLKEVGLNDFLPKVNKGTAKNNLLSKAKSNS